MPEENENLENNNEINESDYVDESPLDDLGNELGEITEDLDDIEDEETLEQKVTDLKNLTTDIQGVLNENIHIVTEDLAELLTNSVNMASEFYSIFLDPDPHYVDLQLYNKEGHLETITIPNRALDKSLALSGEGSPEGSVEGYIGAIYVDIVNQKLYLKRTMSGLTGWVDITPKPVDYIKYTTVVEDGELNVNLPAPISSEQSLNIYVDGVRLSEDKYVTDLESIEFLDVYPDGTEITITYVNGLYGLKGDTVVSVDVGTTRTVNPSMPAEVRNVGTPVEVMLDFDIPKGETGDSGVWVGDTQPEDTIEHLDDKNVWIDTSEDGITSDDLSVFRILDSGINSTNLAYEKAYDIMHSSYDASKYNLVSTYPVNINERGYIYRDESTAEGAVVQLPTNVINAMKEASSWSIYGSIYLDGTETKKIFETNNLLEFKFDHTNSHFIIRANNSTICDSTASDIYAERGAGWYNWIFEINKATTTINLYLAFKGSPMKQVFTGNYTSPAIYLETVSFPIYPTYFDLTKFEVIIDEETFWNFNPKVYEKVTDGDYVKVGNPTIADNGELTQVKNGVDYIYYDYNLQNMIDKNWSIEGAFTHTGNNHALYVIGNPLDIAETNGHYQFSAVIENNYIIFYWKVGNASASTNVQSQSYEITEGKKYFYRFTFSYPLTYEMEIATDRRFLNIIGQRTYHIPTAYNPNLYVINQHMNYNIILGSMTSVGSESITTKDDLNYSKLIVNGLTVRRPLLAIPCVVAKDGGKFTYQENRNFVREAHNMYGKGNIYVIDIKNRTIQLPLSDIYSLCEIARPADVNEIDLNNSVYNFVSPYVYGMYVYADVALNSPGWLLSNGGYYSRDMYPAFYDWIKTNADNMVAKFKKYNNPQYSVTDFDFVINESNQTFRLPVLAHGVNYNQMRVLVDKKAMTSTDKTWYNYYSDGYLEQGGEVYMPLGTTANDWCTLQTVTLPAPYPYASLFYEKMIGLYQLRDGQYGVGVAMPSASITATSFQLHVYNNVEGNVTWRTSGYAAVPNPSTYQNLLPYLYYYVGDVIQSSKLVKLSEISNQLAVLSDRITALGG